LTTKLGLAEEIPKLLDDSIKKMDPRGDEGYVDLFLIHSPSAGPEKRKEQWGELERIVKEGRAKSIGVSN
jgi:diketogulonate reductase-like aldo/keto reductase